MQNTFTKQCNQCKEIKLFELFNKDKYEKDGYRDECRECYKKDYIRTRQVHDASSKRWRENNPKKVLAYSKKFYKRHPNYLTEKSREHRKLLKYMVMSHYSGEQPKCKICGFSDIRALAIDHINNNGAKERKLSGRGTKMGGHTFYAYLKRNKYPEGYQVLCYNCNMIKHIEFISK